MTYLILSLLVLSALTAAGIRTAARHPQPWLLTVGALVALTAIFDNLIVGIGIVEYDDSKILGVLVPIAPIEDFAYAVGAALLVPAVWSWLGRRSVRGDNHGKESPDSGTGEPA